MPRLLVGIMTGTSLDALDAALVEIDGHGLDMRARFIRAIDRPLGEIGPRLRMLAEQTPMTAGQIAALALDFARLHIAAVRDLLAGGSADFVCVHGQTVFHNPPASWQLFNPAPLAHALQTPVVCDLRAADLAAGGQGAPITPLADYILFRDSEKRRAIINLGGFCNVTLLPNVTGPHEAALNSIAGFDVCACNHILDAVARGCLNAAYDRDGAAAAAGRVNEAALPSLAQMLARQRSSGRSLGTGDEISEWIDRYAARVTGPDLARTACEAIAMTVATAVRDQILASSSVPHPDSQTTRIRGGAPVPEGTPVGEVREGIRAPADELILAGGGARNRTLVAAIEQHAARPVRTTADLGVPIESREAVCMAVLGALCQDRVPITLPQVTGVPEPAPVAGVWMFP